MVSKLEYLTRRWYEVDQLRYRKLAEIRQITGDDSWMCRDARSWQTHELGEWHVRPARPAGERFARFGPKRCAVVI